MRVAIVGAGVCGLAAGRRLAARGHEVAIYEQSHIIGGRAATRRTHGCLIDHGAQYFKTPADCPDVRRLVLDELPREGLLDIGRPVWVFDGDGRITPGDPEQNAEPKWSYAAGLATLSQRLAAGLTVHCAAHATSLARGPLGYRLLDGTGATLDEAERVLVTAPAPQALELLRASEIGVRRRDAALSELARVTYRPLLSVMLGFARPAPSAIFAGGTAIEPRPYYALVNADRRHDVSWLAVENDKGPARVTDGLLALVAQMAAPFSRAHFDEVPERLAALATQRVRALLGVELGDLLWFDLAHWRYALPDTTCDLRTLNRDHDGLCFAGDYVAGGRVHLALQAGLDAAALLTAL